MVSKCSDWVTQCLTSLWACEERRMSRPPSGDHVALSIETSIDILRETLICLHPTRDGAGERSVLLERAQAAGVGPGRVATHAR